MEWNTELTQFLRAYSIIAGLNLSVKSKILFTNGLLRMLDKHLTQLKNIHLKHEYEDPVLEAMLGAVGNSKFVAMTNVSQYIKQAQMIIGDFHQDVLSLALNCERLEKGHYTGLDNIGKNNDFVMELKNRYNTDNHSAKITNYEKLLRATETIQGKSPTPIYAVINERKGCPGQKKIIKYKNKNITYLSGDNLFHYIFGIHGFQDVLVNIITTFAEKHQYL